MPQTENELATMIVDAAYRVHLNLGPGLFESIYAPIMAYELAKLGLRVEREKSIPVVYENLRFDIGFRLDLLVEDLVVVELKAIERLAPVHKKQLLTYLRLTRKRLGLLVNFGSDTIRNSIVRVVNGLPNSR